MEEALRLAKAGNNFGAEAIYRSLIKAGSKYSRVYANLGVLCGFNHRYEERLALLRRALELDPCNHQARMNLGIALKENNELDAAHECFEACLSEGGEAAAAYTGLGSVAERCKDYEKARGFYRRALELDCNYRDASFCLGLLELEAGNVLEAEDHFRRCLNNDSADTAAMRQLSSCLQKLDRADQSIEVLRNGVEQYPGDVALILDLVKRLHACGHADEALEFCLRAVALSPESANVMAWCGHCLQTMGLNSDAISCFAKAHELDPSDASILNLWAGCLNDQGDFDGAMDFYERALKLSPEDSDLHLNRAAVLRNAGRVEEAIALLEGGIQTFPDQIENFAMPLMFTYSISSEKYSLRSLELGAKAWRSFLTRTAAEATGGDVAALQLASTGLKPIRVGILCPDLGDHVVSRFLLPFLHHYSHQKLRVELVLTTRRYEQRAEDIIQLADDSVSICGLEISAARSLLQSRRYDVIVETAGMTRNSAIEVLAVRCAPVQCHYIGYHATTALDTIDYFLGDSITVPQEFAWQFSERLWRLPRVWLSIEYPDKLPLVRLGRSDEPLILGSFNQLTKVRAETLGFWGEALNRLPSSQLVLKDRATGNVSMRQYIENTLAQWNVSAERIHFLYPVSSWKEHMDLYNGIDIALDTTPWSGATTTVEALSMGVPVVAICGECTAARMSTSLVSSSGLLPTIAKTPEQFAAFVQELGEDLRSLRQARKERQQTVLSSPLFDGPSLARALEEAFALMLASKLNIRECS